MSAYGCRELIASDSYSHLYPRAVAGRHSSFEHIDQTLALHDVEGAIGRKRRMRANCALAQWVQVGDVPGPSMVGRRCCPNAGVRRVVDTVEETVPSRCGCRRRCWSPGKAGSGHVADPGAHQGHRAGDIARVLNRKVTTVALLCSALIGDGRIYSQARGNTAFAVPLIDDFMKQVVPQPRRSLGRRPPEVRRR